MHSKDATLLYNVSRLVRNQLLYLFDFSWLSRRNAKRQ